MACVSKEPPKKDEPLDIYQFKHPRDDDPPPGAQSIVPAGQPSPYWQHLVADLHQVWEIPADLRGERSIAVGCFHIEPDGKIPGIKLERSGDQILDESVQRALTKIQLVRNDKPQPVPTEQLSFIRKWVCFRFNLDQ